MTSEHAVRDEDRLRAITSYIHGPKGSGAWRQLLYALYVTALLGAFYFFTAARALALAVAEALPAVESWMWITGGVVASLAAVVASASAGRRVGPVTAPLPWVDLVVSSPLDRAVTLKEHWAVRTVGLTAAGLLGGTMLGAALWAADLTRSVALPLGSAIGTGLGILCATAWLAGQLRADPFGRDQAIPNPLRPNLFLRTMSLPHVRAHSLRLLRLSGALFMGDTRVAHLLLATAPARGRHTRLRARGPMRTVVARDVLGLRRDPRAVVTSLALTVLGTAALGYSLAHRLPTLFTTAAVLVVYLGCRRASEGLRSFGDVLASPSVFGLSTRRQAVAHSVMPAVLSVVAWLPTALVISTFTDPTVGLARLTHALTAVTAVSIAAQWITAFRVAAPDNVYFPETGPVLLVIWWFRPLLLATGAGTVLATRIATLQPDGDPLTALVAPVLTLVGVGWLAHRALSER